MTTAINKSQFYKTFFSMWIVLVLQNVITLSVNLADNIMLGGYSEAALAGVAAVNQIQFVYQMLLTAIGEAAVIMGTQYFGKGQKEPIRRLVVLAMHFGVALSLLLFVLASFIPRPLLLIFTTDEAIIAQGMEYLHIIRFTYLFFAITQILIASLRITGMVQISLYLSVAALFINVFFNYGLIYGRFGMPALGAAGAAIATLISRIAEMLILFGFMAAREKELRLRPAQFLAFSGDMVPDYVRVMLPMMAVNSLWGLNSAAQNAILGHMTARAIAANSVASTMFLMVKSGAQGASSTATFFVGQAIGAGDEPRLKWYVRKMQLLFLGIAVVSGLVLFVIRTPILSFYNLEPETRAMANTFLLILSVVAVGMGYQMPVNVGIIRGGGGIRFSTIMDLIIIWGIVIPLSWVLAFVVHASPAAVVWALNSDQLFKAVPGFLMVNYGHWAKKLTKE